MILTNDLISCVVTIDVTIPSFMHERSLAIRRSIFFLNDMPGLVCNCHRMRLANLNPPFKEDMSQLKTAL